MILLTITAGWILVLSMVAGLCMAARRGDAELTGEPTSPAPAGPARRQGWQRPGGVVVPAATLRGGVGAGQELRAASHSALAGVGGSGA